MTKKECSNCRHYMRHYAKTATNYTELLTGHCTFTTRGRARKAEDTCQNYEENDLRLVSQQNEQRIAVLLQRISEQIGRLIEVYDRGED